MEAQAFSVEQTPVIVTENRSRANTGNNNQRTEILPRKSTGKGAPEKINVNDDSLSVPEKNSNRDTIISPNPGVVPLFSVAHDRNPSVEKTIPEYVYTDPVVSNQNRKLSDIYLSKRQSWNIKSSTSSNDDNNEPSNNVRKRSEAHVVEMPNEEQESFIIPLSKDEATKVISDSAQILNAYFDGDSITNLLSDFPEIDNKQLSERKNSAASVRTIIKQTKYMDASSNSKLANSFSLEDIADENENPEMSRYHTIIPQSKKKGKENVALSLLERSMHHTLESIETESSLASLSSQPPTDQKLPVSEQEPEVEAAIVKSY